MDELDIIDQALGFALALDPEQQALGAALALAGGVGLFLRARLNRVSGCRFAAFAIGAPLGVCLVERKRGERWKPLRFRSSPSELSGGVSCPLACSSYARSCISSTPR